MQSRPLEPTCVHGSRPPPGWLGEQAVTGMAEGRLRRDIGLTGSAFLAFNGVVGAGIFVLPGTLHEKFGAFAPWLFPVFGLLVLLIAVPFARLAATHERTGGPAEYVAP